MEIEFDLTFPMYLMVARSLSPTRIRDPTSKSLTSTRLFMMVQQWEQRPTILNGFQFMSILDSLQYFLCTLALSVFRAI